MSWYEESEVLKSTSKALSILDAKYTSPNPTAFDLAAYTMASDATTYPSTYTPTDPAKYTTLPPVYLDEAALDKELTENKSLYEQSALPPDWHQTYHYSIQDTSDVAQAQALCQYVFVLDALNFCFWPLQGYEYEHLASSIKDALVRDGTIYSAESLMAMTPEKLVEILQPNTTQFPLISTPHNQHPEEQYVTAANGNKVLPIPLLHSRVRLLQELGGVLAKHFDGLAYNVVKQANGSARELVRIITQAFPGFRDHSQFANDQIFFYKRVQILVGDLWGAFHCGQGVANFNDMSFLTCFPDYRIPQLFRSIGVLKCNAAFEAVLDDMETYKQNCLPNSEEEILIRCWTVQTVELIKHKLRKMGVVIEAFQLDWLLWERGEKLMKENKIKPHHRTLTTYY